MKNEPCGMVRTCGLSMPLRVDRGQNTHFTDGRSRGLLSVYICYNELPVIILSAYLRLPSCVELYEGRATADGRLGVYQRPTFDDLSVLPRQ